MRPTNLIMVVGVTLGIICPFLAILAKEGWMVTLFSTLTLFGAIMTLGGLFYGICQGYF
jgi:hypothetical protein